MAAEVLLDSIAGRLKPLNAVYAVCATIAPGSLEIPRIAEGSSEAEALQTDIYADEGSIDVG
jgi:hypothetical protein